MEINFQQGVIVNGNYSIANNTVVANQDIILNLSLFRKDYLVKIGAGDVNVPITETETWYYVFYDNNLMFTINHTLSSPSSYGQSFPLSPNEGDVFFNTDTLTFYKFGNGNWQYGLGAFLFYVDNDNNVSEISSGSQVEREILTTIGEIVYSDNIPLTVNNEGTFEYVTTDDILNSSDIHENDLITYNSVFTGVAKTPIKKYTAINVYDNSIKSVNNLDISNECHGIAIRDSNKGEVVPYIRNGIISFDENIFTKPQNSYIWIDKNGKITDTVPKKYSMQIVGHVINVNTAYIKIGEQFLLENTIGSE